MRKKRCTLLKGYLDKKGYRRYSIHGKDIEGHRLVAKHHLPPKPGPDYQVDHINRTSAIALIIVLRICVGLLVNKTVLTEFLAVLLSKQSIL